jgi:ribonuclease BN (tRNA processing enzyme)
MDEPTSDHGTVAGCIELARRSQAARLALVHVDRDVRRNQRSMILKTMESVRDLQIFLPEPGDTIDL